MDPVSLGGVYPLQPGSHTPAAGSGAPAFPAAGSDPGPLANKRPALRPAGGGPNYAFAYNSPTSQLSVRTGNRRANSRKNWYCNPHE